MKFFFFQTKFSNGKNFHKYGNGGSIIMATTKKKKGAAAEHDFIGNMEQSLSELKAGIVDNLIASNEDFKEIVEGMDPKDLADIASDDIDRRMIEAIGSQELKRLKLIDSALTRIKQGKYGLCVKCGKRIPQDRLEAIPYALMCIECKSEEERRNR
jgi:RNA polymerase-binding protein DksA